MILCTCGAQNSSQASLCWLCQRELASIDPSKGKATKPVVWQATAVEANDPITADEVQEATITKQFALSSLLLLGVLLVFLVVIAIIAPGLGILAAICLLPALVNSRIYVLRKQLGRKAITPWERLLVFFASVSTMVGIAAVGLVVAFSTFFVLCLGELMLNRNNLEWSPWAALIAFGITCVVGLIIAVFAWHFSSRD